MVGMVDLPLRNLFHCFPDPLQVESGVRAFRAQLVKDSIRIPVIKESSLFIISRLALNIYPVTAMITRYK